MATQQFTAGKWQDNATAIWAGDVFVAKAERLPDASLIAAAPDLLAALKKSEQRIVQLCNTCNTLSNELGLGDKVRVEHFADVARDAIAKATS